MNGWKERKKQIENKRRTSVLYGTMHKWRISEQRIWGTKKSKW